MNCTCGLVLDQNVILSEDNDSKQSYKKVLQISKESFNQ